MAYFVNSNQRFLKEVKKALENHFGSKAEVMESNRGTIDINVFSGFDYIVDCLSDKELKNETIGGGYIESINGKSFIIKLG